MTWFTSAGTYCSTAVDTVAQQIQIRTKTDRTRVVVRIQLGNHGFLPIQQDYDGLYSARSTDNKRSRCAQPGETVEEVVIVLRVASINEHVSVSFLNEAPWVVFINGTFHSLIYNY